ncbi:MAG: DinB family protein [Dehalococcoidales bacterium]|nr:DinB family protein [Dehalococcoidales bacterium]
MTWQEMIMDIFDRIAAQLAQVLEDLTPKQLNQQPSKGANTIGWLTWHLTRSHDRNMSELMGLEQLWISEGWYARFDRRPDPAETGVGFTAKEMAAFKAPDSLTIMEYHRSVLERIKDCIGNQLEESDLEQEVYSPTFNSNRPAYRIITGVINDGLQHVGQAAYVRGLITKQGWLGR